MSIHEIWLMGLAVACATSPAGAAEEGVATTAVPVARAMTAPEPTPIEEIVASMRELLESAKPEIALPAIEMPLPAI